MLKMQKTIDGNINRWYNSYIENLTKYYIITKKDLTMRDKIIRIQWNKALPLEDAIASDLSNTQGLYYISRVFGNKETRMHEQE